jgi:hypothetical protein
MSVKVTFQAMDGTPESREAIEEHFDNLEQRCGPVRTCRVVIKGLGAGDPDRYGVIIYLGLAEGLELKIGPPPRQDARYADLTFAISDTFRRARRRLQDRRRMRRQSKKPETQSSGRVAELKRGEVDSAGTPPDVLRSAVTATADIQQPITSLRCLEPETDIGSASVVPDAGPEPNRAPEQAGRVSADTESAEPESTTSAIMDPALAEAVEAEPMQAVHATPVVTSVGTAEHSGSERRGSSTPTMITIFNPLGFLTLLSGLLQAMTVVSTNVSNAALHFLQIFYGSTMTTKPSATEKGAQAPDAPEGLHGTVNPSRPPPQK